MNEEVVEHRTGAVLEVAINRPPVNALTAELNSRLHEAFQRLHSDPELYVAVITSAGTKAFCAGWDLNVPVIRSDDGNPDLGMGGIAGLAEFWDLNKPVVAAVQGPAIGNGFEFALAADFIIAAPEATFSLPEVKIGYMPDMGGVQRLPGKVPYNVAVDLCLTGRQLLAQEALQYGLVREIVPRSLLRQRALDFATELAGLAPLALQATKQALQRMQGISVREGFDCIRASLRGGEDLPMYRRMLESDDLSEGAQAFMHKRSPKFTGQ